MSEGARSWVIIGGGVHGVHLALMLREHHGLEPEQVCILDPHDAPLARWSMCAQSTGMRYLRSPAVHHLAPDPWSLRDFAKRRDTWDFRAPYDRPSTALFRAHTEWLCEEAAIERSWCQGRALAVLPNADRVRVLTHGGELVASRVALALGSGDAVCWPAWAAPWRRRPERARHIFEPGCVLALDDLRPNEPVAVIGGGISAAQLAARIADTGAHVTLITRHPLRIHQFDSASGWLGPKLMSGFSRQRSMETRRELIQMARYRGSMPRDVLNDLRRAQRRGRVRVIEAYVRAALERAGDATIMLDLDRAPHTCQVTRVFLATGFAPGRPGGALVGGLASVLPTAPCGFPIVDEALRWHPRVHVLGPLAELELGPTSRNISGARRAAERIVRSSGTA